MLLVQRPHIRKGTWCRRAFAALTHAAAHLYCPDKAALPAEVQGRIRLPRLVLGTDLQRLCHGRRIDNLSRIHEILRIKHSLHLAKGFIEKDSKKLFI
jgi:hypothetical protein